MSMDLVKPYFRLRCAEVGLTKHPEPFNENNIPATLIDYAYQLNFSSVDNLKFNPGTTLDLTMPIEVIFYVKGYRDPDEGQDRAIVKAQELIVASLATATRLGADIKNVVFQSMRIEPLASSNDNVIRVRLTFNTITTLAI